MTNTKHNVYVDTLKETTLNCMLNYYGTITEPVKTDTECSGSTAAWQLLSIIFVNILLVFGLLFQFYWENGHR